MKFSDLFNKDWKTAVIVFANGDYWEKEYPLEARSYRIHHTDKYWDVSKCGSSIYGYSLDGSDMGVRLDWYLDEWDIENIYIEEV